MKDYECNRCAYSPCALLINKENRRTCEYYAPLTETELMLEKLEGKEKLIRKQVMLKKNIWW